MPPLLSGEASLGWLLRSIVTQSRGNTGEKYSAYPPSAIAFKRLKKDVPSDLVGTSLIIAGLTFNEAICALLGGKHFSVSASLPRNFAFCTLHFAFTMSSPDGRNFLENPSVKICDFAAFPPETGTPSSLRDTPSNRGNYLSREPSCQRTFLLFKISGDHMGSPLPAD